MATPGCSAVEAAGGADAVKHGHVQVEQDRVGLVLGHQVERLLAVGGGADHVDAGQPAEQQDQTLADAGLVVGDDDAQRPGRRSSGGHRAVIPGEPGKAGEAGEDAETGSAAMSWDASGSWAATAHSPSRGPASSVPFSSSRRSRMPVSP